MRKVHVKVTVDLYLVADDNVDVQAALDDMDYDFSSNTPGMSIEDMTIEDCEITDSR